MAFDSKQYHHQYYLDYMDTIKRRAEEFRQANPEQWLARALRWEKEHPERHNANCRKSYHKRKRAELARSKKYRAKNQKKEQDRHAKYRATHRDLINIATQKRYASKVHAPINDFTNEQWQEIKRAHNNTCNYCQRHVDDLTMDHMIPLARGGANTADNIVPACRSCNSEKGPKTVLEYFDYVTGGW